MKSILKGREYFDLVSNGLNTYEVAKKYDIKQSKVEYAIEKYKTHLNRYINDEVYKTLYDESIKLYIRGEISDVIFTKAYSGLKRNGFNTVREILNKEELIKCDMLNWLTGKTRMLILRTFFSEVQSYTIDNINEVSDVCDIKKDRLSSHNAGQTELDFIELKKVDLAINYINHGDDKLSKYSKISTYINEAIAIMGHDEERLEQFYQYLALLGTRDSNVIIRYIIANL
jgi:hypothetical protein